MSNYLNSNATPDNFASFSAQYQENKFTKYTIHTEDCPICASNDGRCKHNNNGLILCMNRGKDDVPESIFYRFDYRGLNKTQDWHKWVDKKYSYQAGQGFGKSNSNKKGKQAKKVTEVKRPLSANVLDSIYRGIVKEVGLGDLARQDLINRGIDPDTFLGFSVNNQVTSKAIKAYGLEAARLFPGADSSGILRYAGEGYTCPAFNKDGQVIGYQVRYFDRQPKYTWAATNNKIEINGELELPINLAINNYVSKILHLSEGSLKSSIASHRLGINVLGAAGGNLCASHNQLLENIIGYEQFIWAMDAGAIKNDRVMRQYLRASKVIEAATGIKVQYLWYGQLDKATGKDIDEIHPWVFENAKVISLEELLAIAKDNGVDTSRWELETDTEESSQEDNQETPNNPDQSKLILTNDWQLTKELKSKGQSVVYIQSFYSANVIKPLFERDDLTKYTGIEVITKEGDKYAPWLDPSGKQPRILRSLDGDLERLLGIAPVGDTRNELDLKKFLGTIETEDPYFAKEYLDKLHVKSEKGAGFIYRNMGEGYKAPKITLLTKIGSVPLGSIAYFGSFLPLPNADRDTEGRYFPEINILNDKVDIHGAMVGLRGSMGSGKTEVIIKLILEKELDKEAASGKAEVAEVVIFTPTVYLNKTIAAKIDGCESLNDFRSQDVSKDEMKTIAKLPKISLCLNSAWLLERREYNEMSIVVLEEIKTILNGFLSPNSHYDKHKLSRVRVELARAMRETIEAMGTVIVADANLTDIELIKLAEFAGVDPNKIVRINHQRTDPGFEYTFCDDKKKLLAKMWDMLEEKRPDGTPKRVAVQTDSKRLLEQIEQECENRGIKNVFVMHGDNVAHPKYDGFSDNPDEWLQDNQPTLFGYNSVIGEGVSMQYGGFDAIFMFPFGVLDPDQIRQGSIRFRNLTIPRYIWSNKSRNCDPPAIEYRPSEIRDEIQEGITEALASVGMTSTPEINRLLSQHNPLLDLRSLKLAKDKYQQYGYWKAIEGGLLVAQNCTPFEVTWDKSVSHSAVEKQLVERDAKLVDEAIALPRNSNEFRALDNKAYKSNEQMAQWLKSITAHALPGVDVEYKFAKEYVVTTKGRNQLKKVKMLGDAVFTDLSLNLARDYIKKRVNSMVNGWNDSLLFTEIKKTTRQIAALNRLGVPAVVEQIILTAVDSAYIDPETKMAHLPEKVALNLDHEAIDSLLTKFIKELGQNSKAIGLKINGYLNRFEKLKRILRLVGFKVRQGEDKTVIITLPHRLLEILAAHRQHLQARYDKMVEINDMCGYETSKIPTESGRENQNEPPVEAILDEGFSLPDDEIERLKIEVKNLFGFRKLIGEAKNNVTAVIAGSEPPKLLSS